MSKRCGGGRKPTKSWTLRVRSGTRWKVGCFALVGHGNPVLNNPVPPDCKTILTIDPNNRDALHLSRALPPRISARGEAEKNEAIAKLKQLGNSLLGMVGLSTDNFQMIKDEATGGYSLKFSQGGAAAGAGS